MATISSISMNYVANAARTDAEPLHIARARDVDGASHNEVVRVEPAGELDRKRAFEGVKPVPPALSRVRRVLEIGVAGGR